MRRLIIAGLFGAVLSNIAASSSAQTTALAPADDAQKLIGYVRYLHALHEKVDVRVRTRARSSLPGFAEVVLEAVYPSGFREDFVVHVSGDGRHIVQGEAYEIGAPPFARRLALIERDAASCFGPADARVVLDSFGDFQCRFCKQEVAALKKEIPAKFAADVRVCLHDAPLVAVHKWSERAARAGICLRRTSVEAWWAYVDWIYGQQEKITPDTFDAQLDTFAQSVNLQPGTLRACMDGAETSARLARAQDVARALHVSSVPTLFVNGRHAADLSLPSIESAINYELGRTGQAEKDCGCQPLTNQLPALPVDSKGKGPRHD